MLMHDFKILLAIRPYRCRWCEWFSSLSLESGFEQYLFFIISHLFSVSRSGLTVLVGVIALYPIGRSPCVAFPFFYLSPLLVILTKFSGVFKSLIYCLSSFFSRVKMCLGFYQNIAFWVYLRVEWFSQLARKQIGSNSNLIQGIFWFWLPPGFLFHFWISSYWFVELRDNNPALCVWIVNSYGVAS